MEKIDLIMHRDTAPESFVVNNAVNFVNLSVLAGTSELSNGDNFTGLLVSDNMRILSYGYQLPLGFEIWDATSGVYEIPTIKFWTEDTDNLGVIVETFGKLKIPFPNTEMSLGNVYYFNPALYTGNIKLFAQFLPEIIVRISMVGVSAGLNTLSFKVPIFLKILHTLDYQP